ncbi:hypothetical protein DDB_G0292664 [Dictyostelium discoideum AX4]|uniref:Calponin-homology (CH) domain-containing protein n=1 Tax=Dictyostelium discoideum TaxID=44689 RepID=Q54CW1_DICDI|nr:hypothetical protein DDB_G0292664 [Dictyostelium discoideum AX4]EAL61135.1 hypothetical protein DDB_G0292664 [Dictyostelium discoideum AX4]|eukprot:XP_629559.1 hypothetical protein DDB_G0292664 [Dictyostelium discoideum AX4]
MTDYNFGLDADLANKRVALYDKDLENDTRSWIESLIGEKINGDLMAALKSGVILCKLGNKIAPGSCKSSPSSAPFVQMENVNNFLNLCKKQGVATTDLFMTVDLYEGKNPNQVIQGLQALKRITSGGGKPTTTAKSAPTPSTIFETTSKNTTSFCSQCGTKAVSGARFCGSCGTAI